MFIRFSPTFSAGPSTVVEVLDENSILVDGEVWRVPADIVVVDPAGPILSGWRDGDGTLHLTVLVHYSDADRTVWESPPYRGMAEEAVSPGVISWR